MGSDFIPQNGNSPGGRRDFRLPGIPKAPPAMKTPKNFKFLDRVRVRLKRSKLLELENSEWAAFYAGATGRVIRFNIHDGTLVVVLDTGTLLAAEDRIMESFDEYDLERINDAGEAIDLEGNVIPPETVASPIEATADQGREAQEP